MDWLSSRRRVAASTSPTAPAISPAPKRARPRAALRSGLPVRASMASSHARPSWRELSRNPAVGECSSQARPDLDRVLRGLPPGQGSARFTSSRESRSSQISPLRAGDVGLRLLGHRQGIVRMPLVHRCRLAAALSALQPVFAHRLQHEKTRFLSRLSHLHQQTRIQQRRHCVQDRNGSLVGGPMDLSHEPRPPPMSSLLRRPRGSRKTCCSSCSKSS